MALMFGGDIPTDVKLVASSVDANYLQRAEMSLETFKSDLKYEMGFLCPYSDNEMLEVVKYIEDHAEELFALAREGKL